MLDFPNIYLEADDGVVYHYQKNQNEKQRAFHRDRSKFRWLGGGVGGGKSVAALVEVLIQSWIYKDNFGYILRKTLPELKISAFKDFRKVCPHRLIYEENKSEQWIKVLNHIGYDFMFFQGGKHMRKQDQADKMMEIQGTSEIAFISFEGTQHGEEKFRSSNIGWYFIEQAESCYPAVYNALNERLRRQPSGRKGIFVSNPNGHDWLWRWFHPNSPHRREGHAYFPVELSDNKALPDDYHDTLKATYDEDEYEKMVLGSHEIATGAVYPELSSNIHFVEHFDPPDHWVKGIGLDHGLNNPTAYVLGAKFPEPYEGIYIYDEYQVKDLIVSQHVKDIKKVLTPQFKCFAIDPETKKREPISLATVIGEYNALGVPFRVSSRDRVAGVNRIKEYLAYDPTLRHPLTNELGAPRLFISERCHMLREQLERYKKEELKTGRGSQDPPEKFSEYNVHIADALRYLFMRFTNPLTAKSNVKGFEKEQLTSRYIKPQENDLFDDNGNFSLAKDIERSHKIQRSHGATTWMTA